MTPTRVNISALRKRFGRLEALRGVDCAILPGRITAIVGPNAAGKTTLIKTILGMVQPDSGAVLVDDAPVGRDPGYRERIGYMPHAARFPEQLSGREVIGLLTAVRGRSDRLDDQLIEQLRLTPHLDRPIRTLSGGTRQKLNAAVAFLFRPSLLILDEPTAGLDPVAAGLLKDKVLRAPGEGTTVILTSHIMSEIEELAEDLVFLVEGNVIYQGPVASLLARSGELRLERAIAAILAGAAA
jgi:Cu-processing system ATP-binding protein